MQITYQLTLADFRCGIRAYRKRRVFYRWGYRFGILIVASLVILIPFMLFAGGPRPTDYKNVMPLVFLLCIWILCLWVSPYGGARSQFLGSPAARSPKTMETTPEGLSFHGEHGSSQLRWTVFVTWVEGTQAFAMFTGPFIFIVVPKRAFTTDQVDEFRELLRQNIIQPKS